MIPPSLTPVQVRTLVQEELRRAGLSVLVRQLQGNHRIFIQDTQPTEAGPWAWIKTSVTPPELWIDDGQQVP